MADSPRRRYSRSPSPYKGRSKSRSRSRGLSHSRSQSPRPRNHARSRSRSHDRNVTANHGNTLYVTGLSSRIMERDLEDHFTMEGKVVGCHLVVEPRTRASRGFAFVTMDTTEDADHCIKYLNQSILEGRCITVEKVIEAIMEDTMEATAAMTMVVVVAVAVAIADLQDALLTGVGAVITPHGGHRMVVGPEENDPGHLIMHTEAHSGLPAMGVAQMATVGRFLVIYPPPSIEPDRQLVALQLLCLRHGTWYACLLCFLG
ncbi:unnamed protein product [Musa textilis]